MRYGVAFVLVLLCLLVPAHAAFAAVPFELDPTAGADYGPYVTPAGGDTKAYGVRMAAGGDVNIDTFFAPSASEDCVGYTDTAPDLTLYSNDATRFVRVFFAGVADSTLVVNTGDGRWYCNDDALGTRNPSLDLKNLPAESKISIWVGSYDGNERADGTLYFTTNPAFRVSNPPLGYAAVEQLAVAGTGGGAPEGTSTTRMVGLNFQNSTSSTVWLAVGFRDTAGNLVASGWYEIAPGEIENVLNVPLSDRYYYYYAEAGDESYWAGDYMFWIHPQNAFEEIPDNLAASVARAHGYRQQGFRQIDTGADTTLTLELTR